MSLDDLKNGRHYKIFITLKINTEFISFLLSQKFDLLYKKGMYIYTGNKVEQSLN